MDLQWRLLEYIRQGGWIMIPLGAVSVAMWYLIVERVLAFREFAGRDIGVQDAVRAVQGDNVGVMKLGGMKARLVGRFLQQRTGDAELDKRILQQCAMEMRPGLKKSLAVIAVLAAIAPLLGLLGTVIGMIETFDVIAIFGTGNARALAGGISVALITTQSGLLVAIPGLLMSARLSGQANKLTQRLDQVTMLLANHI